MRLHGLAYMHPSGSYHICEDGACVASMKENKDGACVAPMMEVMMKVMVMKTEMKWKCARQKYNLGHFISPVIG